MKHIIFLSLLFLQTTLLHPLATTSSLPQKHQFMFHSHKYMDTCLKLVAIAFDFKFDASVEPFMDL